MISLRFVASLLIIASALLLCTCSNSDKATGPDAEEPITILVSPHQGIPGARLAVTGYTIDPDSLERYTASIGGEFAPLIVAADSAIAVGIPMFIDTVTGWSVPPKDSVAVEIWLDDSLVASSGDLIVVDSLPHASGTTAEIQTILDTLAVDLQLVFASLPALHSWEHEYRDSLLSVLRTITSGPDLSIRSMLDGTSSLVETDAVDPELIDALIASTGVLEYWQEYAAAFASASGKLRSNISSMQAAGQLCPTFGEDSDLACQMQVYVLLKDFSDEVLSETRQEWSNGMGWLVNILSFHPAAAAFPPLAVAKGIGTLLTVTDIVFSNAILSLLPSHITNFDMTLVSTEMEVDEFTSSQIFLTAANTPQRLTINEMVDLVFATVGLRSPAPGSDAWFKVLTLVQDIINLLRDLYSVFFAIDPDTFGNPDLVDGTFFMFPTITWGPVAITNHDLVELYSFDPDVLAPDTAVFEWWSEGCGEAAIYARTRAAGDRSVLIDASAFCIGCSYYGGAFGNDVAATTTQHVTVGSLGGMDLVITGLPEADSADVWVYFPDNNFEYVGGSKSFTELASGEYRVDANEVEGSDGVTYIGKPDTQLITVTCDSTITANVKYVEKYGNLLLTVSGLPAGLDADIDVTGPEGIYHIVNDTLLDSLVEGTYIIEALIVIDPVTEEPIGPNPFSQEVLIVAGQTAVSSVNYGDRATMTLAMGNPYTNISTNESQKNPLWSVYGASYVSQEFQEGGTIYYPGVGAGPVVSPGFECKNSIELINGNDGDSYSCEATATGSTAHASLSYSTTSDTSILIDLKASATSAATRVGDSDANGSSVASINTNGWAVLIINNPGPGNATLWYDYDITGTGYSNDAYGWGSAEITLASTKNYSCSYLGLSNPNSFFRIFPSAGDTSATAAMASFGPGTFLVELTNHVMASANSIDQKNGITLIRAASISGKIRIQLRR